VYEGDTVMVGDTNPHEAPLFGDSVRYELLCRMHFRCGDLGS
jgi:thymidine kinase